ncbi:3-deoxy-manno-octulosonate cytidylyltransferase [candidate division KSB1 bacterium]|nr:MAG: 3-deoxy-manno-octulosonate cytidylyltransferase [candidate division KSB1 bacterium]
MNPKVKIVGIIPARYESSRFSGKPLALICGRPMIQWVYERMLTSKYISDLLVATDDERIFEAVQRFNGRVVMTSPTARSGTDRVAEVAQNLDADIVVNVQGDEPLIIAEAVDAAIEPLIDDPTVVVSTLVRPINSLEELQNPNTVRVVFDRWHNALYFSRASIPHFRDWQQTPSWFNKSRYFQHVGVYIFRRDFLLKFAKMEQTPLEKIENLEQLRVLENGYPIRVVETDYNPICVDVPEDIPKVEQFIQKHHLS